MLILVGGGGFLGRHISMRAHQHGTAVAVVTANPDRAFLARHAPTAECMQLSQFAGADGDHLLLRATALVYLASRSVPASNVDMAPRELGDNVEPAFKTFVRVSRLRPDLTILYISSGGAVYGRTDCDRIPETEPPRPISPYALGKVLTERCLAYCGDTAGQSYAILRVSNAIGRWHHSTRQGLAAAVLRAIRSGTELEIFGDGTAVRDYLDADDVADAVLTAAAATDAPLQGIWNVGSGIGHSVRDVVRTVAAAAGQEPKIVFKPTRGIDVPRSVLDPSRFARDFGWRARTPFRDAIERLVLTEGEAG